jgi:hypothetical protein
LFWNQPTGSLDFLGHGSAPLVLRRLLMPPFIYLFGLFFFVVSSTRPTFLLGHFYTHGLFSSMARLPSPYKQADITVMGNLTIRLHSSGAILG